MKACEAISFLFVPGDRPERFEKALNCGADIVVLDLEDAVAASQKDFARKSVRNFLDAGGYAAVRISAAASREFKHDIQAIGSTMPIAVFLAKSESEAEVLQLRDMLKVPVIALIETARGFAALRSIAQAAGVARLAFGSVDLQADLAIDGEDDELLMFRSMLILESKLAGLPPPIDGASLALNDEALLHAQTARGKRFGFGAKLCIHPSQLALVHSLYEPSVKELEWAGNVIAAAKAAAGGAVQIEGKLVDGPVVAMAQRIVARRRALPTAAPFGR